MNPDLLIMNGKVMSMVDETPFDWIAIKGQTIFELGHGDAYKKYLDHGVKVMDANGATVLPGFIDSHFHVVQAALDARSLDLSKVKSFKDIGALISAESKAAPQKPIRGIHLDEQNLKENRMPDRTILDMYCNNAPVFLNSVEYQTSVLNTYALLYYKIPFTLEGIDFDEHQMPTGIITNYANVHLRESVLKKIPDASKFEAVKVFLKSVIQKGITTINAMEGGRLYCDEDAEFVFKHEHKLEIDLALFYQTMDIEKVKAMNLNRIGGCLYVDGTFGSRTAALSFDYNDSPGNQGRLNFTQEELNEFVLECYLNHLQLALYTIGDRAIELAITAHEAAFEKTGITGLRHRLEHVELPSINHIRRAKTLGLIFSMSPTYEYIWGGPDKLYGERLGTKYRQTNPLSEILREGVMICGGSDCDVTPADPLLGIHSAVNHPVENHRVSVEDALKMFTLNGAYAIFEEDKKGSLEVGKLADIVILDSDILRIEKEKIRKIKIKATIKSGRIVYNNLVENIALLNQV